MALPRSFFFFFFLVVVLELFFLWGYGDAAVDYKQALTKSLLFFEGQRSGKLPSDQRVQWRGDSALKDGSDAGVDLTGGYYDAGDNVKFGFPYGFTLTTLAWGIMEFEGKLAALNELHNAQTALKWGTDYLIKAHTAPDVLYVQVGDGQADHDCWQRPEDMTTPRTSFKVDASRPGSDVAAESAAALAAASVVFQKSDPNYSTLLLTHAEQLFQFANNHRGKYQDSVPGAGAFYSSSGFDDELQWAAVWLLQATGEKTYKDFLANFGTDGDVRSLFSWDDKWAGVQTMVTKLMLEKKLDRGEGVWPGYESKMVQFICPAIQKSSKNVQMSPGGMLWWQPWNNFQYTASAMLLISAHADHLAAVDASLMCDDTTVTPNELIDFVRSQVNYILGENPQKMSYMIGFGTSYPGKLHHRGASMPSIKESPAPIGCKEGFDKYFNSNAANLHVHEGAVAGGPDANDQYNDSRSNFQQAEAPTVNTSPLVGVLARLA